MFVIKKIESCRERKNVSSQNLGSDSIKRNFNAYDKAMESATDGQKEGGCQVVVQINK